MFQIVHSQIFSQIGRLEAEIWDLNFRKPCQKSLLVCIVLNVQNGHNSATSRPIWLKFRLQVVKNILLAPYETTLLANSPPSTRKWGVQH